MDWTTELNNLGLIGLAGVLGALIGVEREFAEKPAGLRTHCLVAAAAALLTLLGEQLVVQFTVENPDQVLNADPLRIIHAIVIGISFLGTGTIIRDNDHRIEGLTTAASILLTSGVGIAVAIGSYVLAIGVSLGTVIVLIVFRYINALIERMKSRQT
jgi:putative Mg2+ transporter-C (MgtC) family protein